MRNYIFAAIFALGLPGYAQVCTVNWTNVHQRIDGFGASSAWQGTWTTKEADLFFSTNNGIVYTNSAGTVTTNNGIGLSLLRNHISYASSTSSNAVPSTSEITIMQYAQARGALVWSTPWTPASGFKSNNVPDGGNYLGSGNNITNLNYASQLANYVYSMEHSPNNVNIYAISIQNEPDSNHPDPGGYESCVWNGTQIHDFSTNLYNALVAKGVGSTKIIIPESQNWSANTGLYTPTLNDANAAADVSIIADHNYDGCPPSGTPAQLSTSGKSLWETEVAKLSCAGAFDGSITDGIYWAGRIHLFMTAAQANAWHYWWLVSDNPDNEGLTDNSSSTIPVLAKRMFVLGQWSRFVRPNFYRIGASNTGNALISAYKDTNSGNFAIVAVNTSTAINQTFNLTNFTAGSVTPWLTTGNLSLVSTNAVTVSNSSFTYTLPALSVVTFVGQQQTNTPPTLAPVGNQVINAGVTLMVTNAATDADQPPQTLTFSLLNAPTNATLTPLNNTNAVFTWRPLVSQADTTNTITVKVADNGSPSLSATNNFTVKVNPLAQPTVSSIDVSGGQVSLVATGAVGPDYTLWASTNLTSWQVLFTSNSPVTPVTLVDTNFNTYPVRFYRIQLGP
jgi:glucuronoarabinoxylan endo-1,4-beta-xylanase